MSTMKNYLCALSLLFCGVLVSFAQSGGYSLPAIECMGVELDGSQTLRVWALGRNKVDALEQAKKNAVREVIFNGIRNGSKECNMRPLIYEVNAEEKYQYYFNAFFKDEGDYKQYVSMEDRRPFTNRKENTKTQVKYCVTVRVLRAELQQRLIDDKIIKP